MNEGADGSRWIFEEQETQIENDRLAIARLNTKIERLSAKMLVLFKLKMNKYFMLTHAAPSIWVQCEST